MAYSRVRVLLRSPNVLLIIRSVIDLHSHVGVGAAPALSGADDGNSYKGPIVPWLRALDALNTHDESQHMFWCQEDVILILITLFLQAMCTRLRAESPHPSFFQALSMR